MPVTFMPILMAHSVVKLPKFLNYKEEEMVKKFRTF